MEHERWKKLKQFLRILVIAILTMVWLANLHTAG